MISISKKQRETAMTKILGNSSRMLYGLREILGTPETPKPFLKVYVYELYSIFTHAIEEYGKYLYLYFMTPNKSGNYNIEIGVWKDHEVKFNLAIDNLPDDCLIVFQAQFDNTIFSSDYAVDDTLPNWANRVEVLNVDFDENGDPKDINFHVDIDQLRICIWEMQNMILASSVYDEK